MARDRKRAKGRRENHTFAGIPHAVLNTEKYRSLSAHAVKLLLDMTAQYNGHNNGDLTASYSVMRNKGWRSPSTLHNSLCELQAVGFLMKTRQGGQNKCSLYAVTWQAIDECVDKRSGLSKLDVGETNVAPGTWRDPEPRRAA